MNNWMILKDIYELICASIEEEPPISIREGGMIKSGYNEQVDHLRNAKTEGKNWLAKFERGRTGKDRYQKSADQI